MQLFQLFDEDRKNNLAAQVVLTRKNDYETQKVVNALNCFRSLVCGSISQNTQRYYSQTINQIKIRPTDLYHYSSTKLEKNEEDLNSIHDKAKILYMSISKLYNNAIQAKIQANNTFNRREKGMGMNINND